ncbi:MAG: HDOD domain-containing protein [Proteobacteria bacterium]|nr:HDOD domain-containing protein [Desulfobulbaceae bacterium]MBU4154085.1 HDOD domain-containing protein [Pseudomonadota bacterium]
MRHRPFTISAILPTAEQIKQVLGHEVSKLPSLPVVAIKLLRLTRDDVSAASDLVRLIETDPAITAKILRIVNSAAYGLRQKISSIKHAVVLVGFTAVRSLAMDVVLYEQLISGKRGRHAFNRVDFWQHCLTVATLCRGLAHKLGYPDPEEAYIAGLLHDIGKVVAETYGRITYSDFLGRLDSQDGLLVDIEKKIIGLSHADIGAFICQQWGLPDTVVLAMVLHHRRFIDLPLSQGQKMLIAMVSLANFIAWLLGAGSVRIARNSILQPEVEELIPLKEINLQELITSANREIKDIAEFYDFSLPTAEQFKENLLFSNIQLSRFNTNYYYLYGELQDKVKHLTQIRKSLGELHKSLDVREVVAITLQSVKQDFGYDRVCFLQIDSGQRSLKVVGASGSDRMKEMRGIEIEVRAEFATLLACLRGKSPALLHDGSSMDNQVLSQFSAHEMGIIPVLSRNTIIGVLEVDNFETHRPIDPEDLTTLTIITGELGLALENARRFHEVSTLAYHDGLTGIHNRAYLNVVLSDCFKRARNREISLAVGMVDVDFFKKFNDTYGHLHGDSVLKLLASTMKKISRPIDYVGRYGGEEFMFVLESTNSEDAYYFAERLRKEVETLGQLLVKRFPEQALTVSIGVASFQPEMSSVSEVIRKADKALYQAKAEGRNKTVSADQA